MINDINTRTEKYKILIVDDHPIVCRGLRELVADEPDLEVCGDAEDVSAALKQVESLCPDIVVIDLSLKGGHGLELIHEIKAKNERIRMLVSSMHDESLYAERVLRAGAMGYISKQESPDKIIEALRQILRGEIYLSSRMSNRLLHRLTSGQSFETTPIDDLSDRELQVFEMIGQGLSTKEIAVKLDLSHKTIEAHREKIKSKLNLKTGTELNRHATQWVLEST
ncbi:MAG: response regulator transcription factor [Pirellulales bacterium]|nr:response regulator transcription factor [Pirellulales bacterium]